MLPTLNPDRQWLIGVFFGIEEMEMNNTTLEDLNVLSEERLITPAELKEMIPVSETGMKTVTEGRKAIKRILQGF